jgi:acylphosphatase
VSGGAQPATIEVQALVSGRVQGVSFRDATRREAEALGVRGWVRNLEDGRVEARLQGAASRVEALLAWCRQGPDLALVTQVERRDLEPGPPLTGFRILATAPAPARA